MATGGQKRTRIGRVAALDLPPGSWGRIWASLHRGRVLAQLALCLVAAVAICAIIRGWYPPFVYRSGYVLPRDVVARVPFSAVDQRETEAAQDHARRQVRPVYVLDPQPLEQLQANFDNAVDGILAAETFSARLWADFQPAADEAQSPLTEDESRKQFDGFRHALANEKDLKRLRQGVATVLAGLARTGFLKTPPNHQAEIIVYPVGEPKNCQVVKVRDVQLDPGEDLRKRLQSQLGSEEEIRPVHEWLRRHLVPTLNRDERETKNAIDATVAAVDKVVTNYTAGQTIFSAGDTLSADQVQILRQEHEAAMAHYPISRKLLRAGTLVAMILALFALCGVYLYYHETKLVAAVRQLALILLLAVLTVRLATWAAADAWRAELIPVLLFAETLAIAYREELALLFTGVVALIVALALGHASLGTVLLLMGTSATAILQLGSIRTRSKLIHVGLYAGLVAFLLTVGLAILDNQPIGRTFWTVAFCNALWALSAGFLMTGLLPFIEHLFGVLTDISLLELGDVSHPLLQELVRRAPSTYNHSITVGSIAEAAAEAIGARGLLVRVGSYYHDIGKMLKPGYFIETKGAAEENRHESLVPAMSTLVIIAHVKDGSDLARQHGLPEPIVDFIEQHHGTTLVEYFFKRADAQRQADPNGSEIDESAFRYPGPKPQTKEAGVLMLADSVESAARTLVDPAPSRIESLVREVAERKLDDDQFDESGLTLRELRTIENSMIKSLIANYHGRVKYPEPDNRVRA
jgi:cyclic-di-AMP phosphodiesterase PgpH